MKFICLDFSLSEARSKRAEPLQQTLLRLCVEPCTCPTIQAFVNWNLMQSKLVRFGAVDPKSFPIFLAIWCCTDSETVRIEFGETWADQAPCFELHVQIRSLGWDRRSNTLESGPGFVADLHPWQAVGKRHPCVINGN